MVISGNEKIKQIYRAYGDSIYTRINARLYEPVVLFEYMQSVMEKIDLCEPSYIKPEYKDAKASVCVEAPRGSLIHTVEIKDEKIVSYDIIVPTQFNLASGNKNRPSAAQKALMEEDMEYVDTIFKCFDICAVCMSH